jgi:hypothetical protein
MGYGNIQGGAAAGGSNISGNYNRVRSSSMSMIDRSEAAWAILGSTGGYRSKSACDSFYFLRTCSDFFCTYLFSNTIPSELFFFTKWILCRWR